MEVTAGGKATGRTLALASVILGVLWFAFAVVAAWLGLVVKPEGGRPFLDDTSGVSALCTTLTPVVITLGVGLAGVAFAQIRRLTALIVGAAFLHVTLVVWIGVLFFIAARMRAG